MPTATIEKLLKIKKPDGTLKEQVVKVRTESGQVRRIGLGTATEYDSATVETPVKDWLQANEETEEEIRVGTEITY